MCFDRTEGFACAVAMLYPWSMDWRQVTPDKKWYLSESKRHGLPPRCPFAHIMKCPKYYESVELLSEYGGFAQLEEEVKASAEAC